MRDLGIAIIISLMSVGCALNTGSEQAIPEEEAVSNTSAALNYGWNMTYMYDAYGYQYWNIRGFGMTDPGHSKRVYMWLDDGNYCHGDTGNPCLSRYSYSSGTKNPWEISAIGIARNTNHVYTFYSDSTVSEGTPDNLTFYSNGTAPFRRPFVYGSLVTRFSMSQLVEADNSDNGQWYYYWGGDDGRLYRTVGTSRDASSAASAQVVTAPSWRSIVGIAFGTGHPASVYTFYNSGRYNVSTTSLNLDQ
ncbi:MAG TPA: hypothetical protein VJV79_28055 [Polyangiaceae bacterium]|nr:hypothetical protein [Polyangiaceae bacterium]